MWPGHGVMGKEGEFVGTGPAGMPFPMFAHAATRATPPSRSDAAPSYLQRHCFLQQLAPQSTLFGDREWFM